MGASLVEQSALLMIFEVVCKDFLRCARDSETSEEIPLFCVTARLQVKSTPQPGQSSTSTPRWPSPSHSRLPGPGPARAAVRDITCSHGHCHCHPVTVRRSESGPATPGRAWHCHGPAVQTGGWTRTRRRPAPVPGTGANRNVGAKRRAGPPHGSWGRRAPAEPGGSGEELQVNGCWSGPPELSAL